MRQEVEALILLVCVLSIAGWVIMRPFDNKMGLFWLPKWVLKSGRKLAGKTFREMSRGLHHLRHSMRPAPVRPLWQKIPIQLLRAVVGMAGELLGGVAGVLSPAKKK